MIYFLFASSNAAVFGNRFVSGVTRPGLNLNTGMSFFAIYEPTATAIAIAKLFTFKPCIVTRSDVTLPVKLPVTFPTTSPVNVVECTFENFLLEVPKENVFVVLI